MHGCFYGLLSKNNEYRVNIELVQKIRYIKKTFRYMKLSPDHKRSDFKIKSIRIIQPDLQAKEIQIIDVKEIYDRRRYNISREALQKLTESFEDHAKSLEGRTKQQDQSAQMLEDAIRRSSVWKNSSQRAQQFLAAQDKKKENPENLPEHFSENVIKAGAMFRDKFVKNGQEIMYPFRICCRTFLYGKKEVVDFE